MITCRAHLLVQEIGGDLHSDVSCHLNGGEIRVIHVDPAHTDGDSLVYFAKANVIHMGDTFFNGFYPFIDTSSGGHPDGVIAVADRVIALSDDNTRIIPGHGPVCDKKDLKVYRDMPGLRGAVARNLRHRKNLMRQQQLVHEKNVNDLLQQQEIRSLEAMLEGQDKERGRISQDLHDVLGSKLSATKMQFNSLEAVARNAGTGAGGSYDKVYAMLDDAVVEVRRISHDMARGSISRMGLIAPLQDLRNTIQVPGKLDVELNLHGLDDRLEQHTELVLYRIVQELVSNVLKHSRARHLTIQVVRSAEGVNLTVEDDGVGFDPARFVGGMGLSGVRTRAAELGGRVEVDPQLGRETTVMIDVPVASRR